MATARMYGQARAVRELGISKSWASRLHTKALERLKEAIERE